ncbi:28380_t:CDS:2 [Dentiscutata erythropus]|uniref:28380_t:CDS:1 n=1 Tax=Dentiscutata erythropus TaxID=1348616 RepID=A0A9N9C489_9GLOM|nr:28380_t:CDS:2 [Dentiscutata erythropus]
MAFEHQSTAAENESDTIEVRTIFEGTIVFDVESTVLLAEMKHLL